MVASTHWLASPPGWPRWRPAAPRRTRPRRPASSCTWSSRTSTGPGGDLPVVLATAGDPRPTVLCGQGAGAGRRRPRPSAELGLDLVPGTGPLAAVVPGAVGGWLPLLRDHGRLPLRDVLAHAIGYARDGVPVLPRHARRPGRVARAVPEDWPTSAARSCRTAVPAAGRAAATRAGRDVPAAAGRGGAAAGPGARSRPPGEAWHAGFVAEAVDAFSAGSRRWTPPATRTPACSPARTWPAGGRRRAAGRPRYRGYEVLKTGPWGQGPVLLQELALLAGSTSLRSTRPPRTACTPVVEAPSSPSPTGRRGTATRPDVPLAGLLVPGVHRGPAGLVADRADCALRPGSPGGRGPGCRRVTRRSCPAPAARGGRRADRLARGETAATPATSTWSTAGATWSRRPRAAAGCRARRSSPSSGSRSGRRLQMTWLRGRGCRQRSPRAGGRAPRSRRPSRCGAANRCWPSGPPAATSRTSGSCFPAAHALRGLDLQEAIDAPTLHNNPFPCRSTRAT